MHFFRYAVFSHGLIKRREIAFCAGCITIAKGLHQALEALVDQPNSMAIHNTMCMAMTNTDFRGHENLHN